MRKDPLGNGQLYHIYSRSIARYKIFNDDTEFARIIELIYLCRYKEFNIRFSYYQRLSDKDKSEIIKRLEKDGTKIVDVIAYCVMPTHIHLLLCQKSNKGISKYMANILNSYTRYFNCSHGRKGPLWEGRFKNVSVNTDDQLLHLTRYIHLNPCSASIVNKPENWKYSSVHSYLSEKDNEFIIADSKQYLDVSPKKYRSFLNERIDQQRELSTIKLLIIEDYSG